MNPVTVTGCTSADIGVGANLELVNKFCYLGDMFEVARAVKRLCVCVCVCVHVCVTC